MRSAPLPAPPQFEVGVVRLLQRTEVSDGNDDGAGEFLPQDAIKM